MKSPLARLSSLWRLPGWLPEIVIIRSSRIRNQVRLLALAGLVGIVAGVGAIVFYVATRAAEHYALGVVAGYCPEPRPGGEPSMAWLPTVDHPLRLWLLLVVPTVGGLLSGILVFTLAPEAEGHGTDSAIAAYHYHQGQIRPRVPLVKIIASALTLGTGGSGGREGPIAQIGAGFGSVLGNLLRLRPAERRRADGRRHGLWNRRDLPRAAGRDDVRGRSPLPLSRIRARGDYPDGNRQRHLLLHLRGL